jgi:hypothetical protein
MSLRIRVLLDATLCPSGFRHFKDSSTSTATVNQSKKNGFLTLENEGNKIIQNFGTTQPVKKRYKWADLS